MITIRRSNEPLKPKSTIKVVKASAPIEEPKKATTKKKKTTKKGE